MNTKLPLQLREDFFQFIVGLFNLIPKNTEILIPKKKENGELEVILVEQFIEKLEAHDIEAFNMLKEYIDVICLMLTNHKYTINDLI